MGAHLRRPWRLLGPAASILRSRGSRRLLEQLREHKVPVFVIHGGWDLAVPLQTAKDAARRARGDLVVVRGASHSWILKDPETLPGIMLELMRGRLGTAVLKAKLERGVDPVDASQDEVEAALYAPGAAGDRAHAEGALRRHRGSPSAAAVPVDVPRRSLPGRLSAGDRGAGS